MTKYVVLSQHSSDAEAVWTWRGEWEVAKPQDAIRECFEVIVIAIDESVRAVAIPSRSFNPLLVTVETAPRVSVGKPDAD